MCVTADMLPDDVLLAVFSYCSHSDLVRSVQHVCKRWESLSKSKSLWKYIVYHPSEYTVRTDIIEMLRLSPKLQIIDLSEHDIIDNIVRAVGDYCPDLRVLRLHRYMDVNLGALKHLVKNCPDIELLTVPSSVYTDVNVLRIIKDLEKMKSLIIKTPFASNGDVNIIALNFPYLEHLELLFYELKESDIKVLLQSKASQLRVLRLHCSLSDNGCVLPHLSPCTRLKTLSLEGLCGGTEGNSGIIRPFESVSTLTVKCAYFFTASYMCTFFKAFPRICELHLSYCESANEIIDIISFSCPLIRKITLNNGFVGDETLFKLHYLKKLDSICVNWSSSVTDDGVKSLKNVCELKYLKFTRCENITDSCLGYVSHFAKLRDVEFERCKSLQALTLDSVRNNLPHLNVSIVN